jgi:eukaryotic-like serine/threonine-protein kinase
VPEPPRAPNGSLPEKIGRYEILRLLGEGAMGRVLLAHDPVLEREVAVKHLRDDLKIPRDVREGLFVRMRHEARAAARVAHPNLVTLHDMGEDAALGLSLVFEYVEGPTLKQQILEGRMPPDRVARIARELGAGLTVAHGAGIVHRDVKPENIILSKTGAKVADFGIARIPDSTLTHQGGLMGTPAYSAPETFRTGTFSPASDQFSLAASVYEALAGRRAFPGDDAVAVAAKIAHERPAPVADELGLPPAVDAALGRGMAADPESRFPSCEAFGAALARGVGRIAAGRPGTDTPATGIQAVARSHPPAAGTREELPRERRVTQVALGGAVVVITAGLLLRTALRSDDAPADPPAASARATASVASAAPPPRPHASAASASKPLRPRVDPSGDPRPAASSGDTRPAGSSVPATAGADPAVDAGPPAATAPPSAAAPPRPAPSR